jgi:AbrB family looped-hinge helix DNA binding protein
MRHFYAVHPIGFGPHSGKERYAIVRNGVSIMKKAARITSKGQITVPHEIRRALGVLPGDKLVFEKDGVSVRIRPMRAKSPFEKYRGIGSPGIARGKKAAVAWVRKLRGR